MKIERILKTELVWLPSIIITMFFIPNAIEKIFQSNQMDKIVTNNVALITIGIILLIERFYFCLIKPLFGEQLF